MICAGQPLQLRQFGAHLVALQLESGQALVKAGANVNLADRAGRTPLALAKGRGYTEMVAILEKAGAK